ncbi:MAG: transglycosylase SLT domain-containing protein [Bacteroidales bacterium]|nr:transglycosylase SLT domain-containing protein [Bacteroidales bacterium]
MKRFASIFTCLILSASLFAAPSGDGWKSRKKLRSENDRLKTQIAALEAELAAYRQEAAVRESITEELSGENENKVSAALEDYTTANTDSLLGRWYMHRSSKYGSREQYNMDSVRFTTDVPDSVLMRRLEEMNSFIRLPYNETVKNYMILYSEKMPRRMSEVLGLSEYYMPIFEETFRKYDLPLELKYVSIIESSLNPRAESYAGAKGMWQFMYRTGLSYGLKIDSYIDERMDPVASADAAARYFRDAYRIFGDWALAISAYNCGSGNVNKAIKRAGGKTDFWSIYEYLPRETRGYVPAMVGAMYAMNYAKEYGLRPDPIALPVYVDTFHIGRNLHLAQVSEVLGIPLDDVRDLNPQYHKDIIPGGGNILRLPFDYSSAYLDMQDSIFRYKADVLFASKVQDGREVVQGRPVPTSKGTSWVYYKVRRGDNLGSIARRNHTTVKNLKSWNNLRGDMIREGQRLKVGKR